jgi:5-methylcytosine-specific restriction endonuclease McrA
MKRGGFLKRRTPLRAKAPLKRSKHPLKASKTKKKTPNVTSLKKKLWTLCRELTRKTHGNTCYTCGRTGLEGGNWQTGHFISSSICSVELRYDLQNLRPQCYNCNINKSGNWIAYEERLTREFGQKHVDDLKQRNRNTTGKQYDILWYQAKIAEYEKL